MVWVILAQLARFGRLAPLHVATFIVAPSSVYVVCGHNGDTGHSPTAPRTRRRSDRRFASSYIPVGVYDESCYWLSASADPLHAMCSVYLVEYDIWVLCTSTDRSLPLSNGRTGKSSLRPSTYNRLRSYAVRGRGAIAAGCGRRPIVCELQSISGGSNLQGET